MRVVVIREGEMLVAQGLEHDICTQAPDVDTLARRFHETVLAEAADGLLDGLPPAPAEFHAMWDAGDPVPAPWDAAGDAVQIDARQAA